MNMIPEDHKDRIIGSGIEFMRSITMAYGADAGMELYERIVEVLDPSIKSAVFFAMLTGKYQDTITVRAGPSMSDRVLAIKTIRYCTGMGLKEAKDLVDKLQSNLWNSLELKIDPNKREVFRKELVNAGFIC
jgi:ribosomal protein L7/L12